MSLFRKRYRPNWKNNRQRRRWLKVFGQPEREKSTTARERRPDMEFVRGGVASQVFINRTRFGRKEYLFRVGRWQTNGRRFFLEELFYPDDATELREVIEEALLFIREETITRYQRRP